MGKCNRFWRDTHRTGPDHRPFRVLRRQTAYKAGRTAKPGDEPLFGGVPGNPTTDFMARQRIALRPARCGICTIVLDVSEAPRRFRRADLA